jgi:tetratricopeptide (TPR) repeat protein
VAKSPGKVRPRFQLAFAYYDSVPRQCGLASDNYEIASHLAPPDYRLLVDWGLALDCANRPADALDELQAATRLERDPQAWVLIGQVYGKRLQSEQAFKALEEAQKIDPGFGMTYAVRANVYQTLYQKTADKQYCAAAAGEFQHAVDLNYGGEELRKALAQAQAQCR